MRAYRHFGEGARPHSGARPAPLRPELYAGQGRMIDLAACYQSPVPDSGGFAGFVRQAVRDVAAWGGGKVQVGEEPNVPAPLDGGSPGCLEAIGASIAAALEERDRHDAPVLVGVNAAGLPDPAFWNQLTRAIGPDNARRLNYVGLDAFPDVFKPIPHQNLAAAVTFLSGASARSPPRQASPRPRQSTSPRLAGPRATGEPREPRRRSWRPSRTP